MGRQDKCPRILLSCYRARNSVPEITFPALELRIHFIHMCHTIPRGEMLSPHSLTHPPSLPATATFLPVQNLSNEAGNRYDPEKISCPIDDFVFASTRSGLRGNLDVPNLTRRSKSSFFFKVVEFWEGNSYIW